MKIELTKEQVKFVVKTLNLMAQNYFDFAVECDNEDLSIISLNKQIECDEVLEVIQKQVDFE